MRNLVLVESVASVGSAAFKRREARCEDHPLRLD